MTTHRRSSFSYRALKHGIPSSTKARQPRKLLAIESLEERLAPATLTVNTLNDNDTTLPGDSTLSLREAVKLINSGTIGGAGHLLTAAEAAQVNQTNAFGTNDTIVFTSGLAGGTITLTASAGGEISIAKSMTVNGLGAGVLAISGNNQFRVLKLDDGNAANFNVSLSGLTITAGNAGVNQDGGGILNSETLTLNGVVFSTNTAKLGAGLNNAGTATIINSTFSGNFTSAGGSGGGIYNVGTATLTNSSLQSNSAQFGGGIENLGSVSIASSTLSANTASSGGGIDSSGPLILLGVTLSANVANTNGGGIFSQGTATVTNTTLSGNSAKTDGGGFYNFGTAAITNSTLTANRADSDGNNSGAGGGLFRIAGTVTLNNTLIAGNFKGTASSRDDGSGAVAATSANNLIGDVTGLTGIQAAQGNLLGASLLPIDPLLGPLADNAGPTRTHALLAGSPALGAGNNANISGGVTMDQRGLARISGGTVDIGAFEKTVLAGPYVVNTISDIVDANFGPGQLSLREAILLSNDHDGADAIAFSSTVFATPQTIKLTQGQLTITGDVTIRGPGALLLSINGNNLSRVFNIDDATAGLLNVALSGLSIIRGNTGGNQSGGGILNGENLTLANVVLSANFAGGFGGGIANMGLATITSSNSTFSENSAAADGGGIYNEGSLIVTNCTVSGNITKGGGGGISIFGGTNTITNSTLTANRADFDDNGGNGGGLQRTTGTLALHNTLVAGNFKGSGSSRDDLFGPVGASSSNNLIGDGAGLTGITNGNQGNQVGSSGSPIDPLLGPLANNGGPTRTHALLPGSPALNAGSNAKVPAGFMDQRGLARISGGTVDIGAFEKTFLAGPYVVDTTSDDQNGIYNAGQLSLREAILLANDHDGPDTITFSSTVFANILQTIILSHGELPITSAITLNGPGASLLAVSGNNLSRVFNIDDATTGLLDVALSGLSITSGRTGAGQSGGGIQNSEHLTLANAVLSGNSAGDFGGGIENFGMATITNSTVTQNSALDGGGIDNAIGTLIMTNSTVSGNSARRSGGGIFLLSTATITNSTITANRADSSGSGDGAGGGLLRIAGTATLNNTLVAGNFKGTGSARDDANGDVSPASSNNLIGDGDGLAGITNASQGNQVGSSDSPINPLLGPLVNNGGPTQTHTLLAGSPALNAGMGSPRSEVQTITVTGASGSFTFTFGGETTAALAFDAAAADVQSFLNALAPIGGIGGAVSVSKAGAVYTITFGGALANTNVDKFIVATVGGASATVSTLTDGFGLPLTDQRGMLRISGGTVDIGAVEKTLLAGPYVVDTDSDVVDLNYGPGQLSLREAIQLSNDHDGADTIRFNLAGAATITLGSELVITDSLTLNGPGADLLAVSGNGRVRVFTIDDAAAALPNVSLSGLRITAGNASAAGGILNRGNLTLTGVVLSGNTADFGGGIVNFATVTIASSRFSGNVALGDGGGIYGAAFSITTITSSTFSGNIAANDGGAILTVATALLINSTLSGNEAGGSGGGIFNSNKTTLVNCTLTANRADSDGNGISGEGGGLSNDNGFVTLQNTLIAGNFVGTGSLRDDVSGAITAESSNNLIGDGTGLIGITNASQGNRIGTAGSPINPLLGALADNGGLTLTHALLAGSPALNSGSNAKIPAGVTTDQRGVPFTRTSGVVDIGAFESQLVHFVVDTTADVDDGNYVAGDLSLREAIKLANVNAGADTITFNLAGTITLGSQLIIKDSVTLIGPGAGLLAISGNHLVRVFTIDDTAASVLNVSLSGVTITAGNGGMFGNASGGGIVNRENLTLTNVVLSENSAKLGGGVFNDVAATVTISNSTLSANSGAVGGAINNAGTATISSSTLSGNSAQSGGAIDNTAILTLTNCTLSGNSASSDGGAISSAGSSGTATLINCTVTANRADSDGNNSGIGGGVQRGAGTVTLKNTIIAGNFKGTASTPDDINGLVAAASSNNLIGDAASAGGLVDSANANTVGVGGTGTRAIATILNPALADNGGLTRTHALVQNSLAIAAASSAVSGFSAFDQRDAFRDPGAPDIGAYEVQHPLSPVGTPSTYARTFLPKPSPDANTAFVKGLYQSTLLRGPDPAGLASWVTQLNSGASRQAVTFGFINSAENRAAQVTFFYQYFLGRGPDPTGLANWVSTLQSGVDEGTVMSGFLLSPEFTGQNDNASFVNLMYFAILGRQAEPAGFAGWKSQLDSGALTRDQVGYGFLRSVESITRVVTSYFGNYLKRTIDSAAASPFVGQSQAGVTFGRIAANILGSDEFFVAAGQNLD